MSLSYSYSKCHTCFNHMIVRVIWDIFNLRDTFTIRVLWNMLKILKKVCFYCSTILVHQDSPEFQWYCEEEEFKNITTCSKINVQYAAKKKCSVRIPSKDNSSYQIVGCGKIQPIFRLVNEYTIEVEEDKELAFKGLPYN